jgi:GAF domain-containing protein/FixJ family two-component response regulator
MKSQETSKPKLLVVDDEPDNLDLLYRTFHREYTVLRADSGPDALEILAKEGDIAVIISDQRMPLMSGTEFLSLTATRYPDIIRIILTGYTDVEDLVEAINAGKVFKFVTKPWNSEDLKAVVRQAMDTHNVLKVRTRELCRALRRESLLNTVTNTIRNAQFGQEGDSPLKQILQRIVESVGHLLEVDVCILRPFQDGRLADEWFVYQKNQGSQHSGTGEEVTARDSTPQNPEDSENSWSNVSVFSSPRVTGSYFSDSAQAGTSNGVTTNTSCSYSSSVSQPSAPNRQSTPYASLLEHTVWETREVEVINDVWTDERFKGEEKNIRQRAIAYQQAEIRSTLVVPLISQQELVAVLALHQCGEPYYWQDDEIQLVVMVADQAAMALSQARAYEQVQALATQQALVNTITNAIRSTLDPQEIFTAITQKLGQALKVDGCALSLWREEDEFVQCVGLYDGKSTQVVESQEDENSNASSFSALVYQLPQSLVPISGW